MVEVGEVVVGVVDWGVAPQVLILTLPFPCPIAYHTLFADLILPQILAYPTLHSLNYLQPTLT